MCLREMSFEDVKWIEMAANNLMVGFGDELLDLVTLLDELNNLAANSRSYTMEIMKIFYISM
jgi:hypothetical protein